MDIFGHTEIEGSSLKDLLSYDSYEYPRFSCRISGTTLPVTILVQSPRTYLDQTSQPAVASADFQDLKRQLAEIEKAQVDELAVSKRGAKGS